MNCWKILGVEPTGNKKDIKRAYATLLKTNKPDENPEGFSRLNKAYKQCLSNAAYISYETANEKPTPDHNTPEETVTHIVDHKENEKQEYIEPPKDNIVENTTHTLASVEPDYLQNLQQQWTRITEETEQVLSDLKEDDISQWDFIYQYDSIYDFQFKNDYSYYLLEKLIEFFKQPPNDAWQFCNTLEYFNQIFLWTDQQYEIEGELGYDNVEKIFNILLSPPIENTPNPWNNPPEERPLTWVVPKQHEGELVYANLFMRIGANVIDTLLIFFCTTAIVSDTTEGVVYSLFAYIVIISIMQASPLQGSLGQILFGMKATTKKGSRLNIAHSFFRQICFCLSNVGFQLTIWWNVVALITGGKLIHDSFSFSVVIKR